VTDRLVWIDCEMTGLELAHDALIEVAALVTDSDLNVLGDGIDVVIHADDESLDNMVDVVRHMHARSGLTELVRNSAVTMAEAEERVLEYITAHVPEPKSAPLCGNSIATDRGFIARDMPALDAHLHYRMVDVSSIKELTRRWYPDVLAKRGWKHGAHRALDDIRESVSELRLYRQLVFRDPADVSASLAKLLAAEAAAEAAANGAAPTDVDARDVAGEVTP
jgi:oligoribonuclease